MKELILTEADFRQMVMAEGGQPVTTSLKVAKYFKKRHDNVVRAIRNLKKDCPSEFWLLNFEERDFIDSRGKRRSSFEITKDGFVMLVMGFTGATAVSMKIAYINAFNWMADRLLSYDFRRNEVVAAYRAEQSMGSACGRGLNRWKHVKRDLEMEMERISIEGQLSIPLSGVRQVAHGGMQE